MGLKPVSLLIIGAIGLVGLFENHDMNNDWQPIASPKVAQQLSGPWLNRTLGHVAVFSGHETKLFHHFDTFCIADTGVIPAFSIARFAKSPDRLDLFYYDYRRKDFLLQNPLEYVRLSAIPEPCRDLTPSKTVALIDVFDLVWRHFDRYYAFFRERGVDWDALGARYRPRALGAKTENDLFNLLAEMLGHFNDSHLNLTWQDRAFNAGRPKLRERLAAAWQAGDRQLSEGAFVGDWAGKVRASIVGLFDQGTYTRAANGALEWGIIGEKTGYLRINRFSGFSKGKASRQGQMDALTETLTKAGKDLSETTRLIVDVSHNGGGNDAAAMIMAAAFMDKPRDVLQYDVEGTQTKRIRLAPERAFYQKDLILVTSEITVSAAEAFVLMMKTLPNIHHVGGTTRGALSGLLPKPLPRGFRVTISYQRVLDAQGRSFEGRGIPPDETIELFADHDLYGSYKKQIASLANSD